MNFAKILLVGSALLAFAVPASAANLNGLDCGEATVLRQQSFGKLEATMRSEIKQGTWHGSAAFLNGDYLAVPSDAVLERKNELWQIDRYLASHGCGSERSWHSDWSRL